MFWDRNAWGCGQRGADRCLRALLAAGYQRSYII
jgi:hypothetical protein